MWFPFLRKARQSSARRPARPSYRPRLMALEDRCLLSAGWAVSNGGNGTMGTLPALSQPDSAGNLYTTGYFTGSATFGNSTLNSSTEASYVAKIDPNGNFLWATQFGGAAGDVPTGIAIDSSGNVYVTGNFGGTASFGNTSLTSAGGTDIYICKLDGNGNVVWARQAGGASGDQGETIAVDASGSVFVSGEFDHGGASVVTATFGLTTLTTTCSNVQGAGPVFLAKLDGNGSFLWSEQLLDGTVGQPFGMRLDNSGNMYIAGDGLGFQGSSNNGFIEKVDPSGNATWAQGTAIALLAEAIYQDPMTGATALYVGGVAGTLEKLDAASGTMLWSETFPSPITAPQIRALTVDGSANVYAAGDFSGSADFDRGPGTAELTSVGLDVFLLKLDPSGNFESVRRFAASPSHYDYPPGLAVDASGNIYTAGSFSSMTSFDTGSQTVSLTSTGSTGLFVCHTTQELGAIFGQVFNDLNNNGLFDPSGSNPETGLPNVTVYLDTNNNGVLDPGEPRATAGSDGRYELNHIPAGACVVREMSPAGWQQSYPSANGANAVTLSTGQFVDTQSFGDYIPSQTKTYTSGNVPVKIPAQSSKQATSTLAIADVYSVFDLTLSLSITGNGGTNYTLTAPDGTVAPFSYAANVHLTAFNYHGVKGTWTLTISGGSNGGTLKAWSLTILGTVIPQIGSLTSSASSVTAGTSVTLTASNITDANPNSTITQVAFYVDSNKDGILDAGDTLLGYGTLKAGKWTFTFSTAGWASGTYTLFAQAEDNDGLFSDPFALKLTVQ